MRLARTKPVVVVEELRPANPLCNPSLTRSLSVVSFGESVRQLEHKGRRYGARLGETDPFFRSTKKCSSCGNGKEEMPRSERTYRCAAWRGTET